MLTTDKIINIFDNKLDNVSFDRENILHLRHMPALDDQLASSGSNKYWARRASGM